jgi:hypothetical protein
MNKFLNRIMKAAPGVLLAVAIINVLTGLLTALGQSFTFINLPTGLVTTMGQSFNPLVAFAASINAGLIPFIAAAVLYRVDQHLKSVSQASESDLDA